MTCSSEEMNGQSLSSARALGTAATSGRFVDGHRPRKTGFSGHGGHNLYSLGDYSGGRGLRTLLLPRVLFSPFFGHFCVFFG